MILTVPERGQVWVADLDFPVLGAFGLGVLAGNEVLWAFAKHKGSKYERNHSELKKVARILVPFTLALGMVGALFLLA